MLTIVQKKIFVMTFFFNAYLNTSFKKEENAYEKKKSYVLQSVKTLLKYC